MICDVPSEVESVIAGRRDRSQSGDRPTADHLYITRLLRHVVLETDEPRIVDINPLHV